jgi:Trk K+ transport system NAD-binding subunit
MIVGGGGAIALSTVQELCTLQGHRVVVLWRRDADLSRAVEDAGAVFIAAARPDSIEALARAGVTGAVTILALSPDGQLNLHAALLARDLNPQIRIVLRQFNRTLARKIEQNLPNCSVLSLAWHSAATYAAAAIDPTCFRGLQFPEPEGPLTGFTTRIAESCGLGGEILAEAEQLLGARILAVDGNIELSRDTVLAGGAELVVYGDVAGLESSAPRRSGARTQPALGPVLRSLLHRRRRQPPRLNPILVRLALAALGVFLLGTCYFHAVFKGGWLDAVYFVVATVTTTGYGDLTPSRSNPGDIVATILLMLSGTIITGLFIAFGASLLTRTGSGCKACGRCIAAGTLSFAGPAASAAK